MSGIGDYQLLGQLPPVTHLNRNGRTIEASRVELGRLRVDDGRIWIADSAWVDQVPALPLRVPRGDYGVYAYQWLHRTGPINVCAVVAISPQPAVATRRLRIETDIRPDLTEGIIVDTAEAALRASNSLTLPSGLGDGYYPVFANFDANSHVQSIVIDFKIWEFRNCILSPGQRMDEFGIPETVQNVPQDPGEASRIRASYRNERIRRVAADIASGTRFQSRPPCPSCGRPLRTAKARQCFLCGYRAGGS